MTEDKSDPDRNKHGLRLLAELNEIVPFVRPGLGLAESAYATLRDLLIQKAHPNRQ